SRKQGKLRLLKRTGHPSSLELALRETKTRDSELPRLDARPRRATRRFLPTFHNLRRRGRENVTRPANCHRLCDIRISESQLQLNKSALRLTIVIRSRARPPTWCYGLLCSDDSCKRSTRGALWVSSWLSAPRSS